ncbi:MAG: ispA [Chlamydiales bacterium]|jgi:geranylgeranyl diphosphate synthase type II|nr:ispA [Chlamydiales bacterium]
MTDNPLSQLIQKYQPLIEEAIQTSLCDFGSSGKLYEACAYALTTGGKRFRPALVWIIADALGSKNVKDAALAVEYFHTASLIADDLPCMDNDAMRRNRPTVHKAYGESTALLSTYALISAGYLALHRASQSLSLDQALKDRILAIAIETVSRNTGVQGATGGQFLDLERSPNTPLEEILRLKTVTLFEISFVFGWLFGGGKLQLLPIVQQASYHFGMAFQIVDDLQDLQEDIAAKRPNYAATYGVQKALQAVEQEVSAFLKALDALSLNHSPLKELASNLLSSLQA